MRKYCLLPLLVLMAGSFSCKKESAQPNQLQEGSLQETGIAVKTGQGQPYTFNVPEAGNLTIVRQAAHFTVSETRVNEQYNTPSYTYIPSKGFTGTDEVTLQFSKTVVVSTEQYFNGCVREKTATDFSKITIKITVGD